LSVLWVAYPTHSTLMLYWRVTCISLA
jgi:hypothetical protein